jgi:ankyrin repeat protein
LSRTSLLESRRVLKASGASSSDNINLYKICFALSASLASEANDVVKVPSSAHLASGVACEVCGETTCLWEECLRNFSSRISADDYQSWADAEGNTNLHRAVQHGHKTYLSKLLDLGADPCRENKEGMNPAVFGWGFLLQHKDDEKKYANIWVCMLRVLERQRENKNAARATSNAANKSSVESQTQPLPYNIPPSGPWHVI